MAGPLLAQAAATAGQKPDAKAKEEEAVRRSEQVTVESASKVESKLIDAPATMSVVTSETLAAQPAQNMAGTLRSVPGMNVIQTSARDTYLTARQATSTLSQENRRSQDAIDLLFQELAELEGQITLRSREFEERLKSLS